MWWACITARAQSNNLRKCEWRDTGLSANVIATLWKFWPLASPSPSCAAICVPSLKALSLQYLSMIDGVSGKVFLDQLMAERGPMRDVRAVPEAVAAAYVGRVPDIIIDLWRAHGVGNLAGGRLRLCLPSDFTDATGRLFDRDPDFAGDCHVIAHSAFGDLLIWSERHWLVHVGMLLGMVDAPMLFDPKLKVAADKVALDFILKANPALLDMADAAGGPMFEPAQAALGRLKPGQIYGLFPLPFNMDAPGIDALQIVPADQYLDAKLQMATFPLWDPVQGQSSETRSFGAAP